MKRYQVGDRASLKVIATEQIVNDIARISGDVNPIHLDEEYAKHSIFKKRIAHALFCINTVSRILGTVLPGEGTILLSQEFKYLCPVYIGDSIEVSVVVTEIKREKNIYVLNIDCVNQENVVVMEGKSVVKYQG